MPDSADENDGWKLKTPAVILAGAWNTGVNPLRDALVGGKQKRIRTGSLPDFFLPRQFYKYTTTATVGEEKLTRVKVYAARQRMYAQVYSNLYNNKSFKSPNNTQIAMDVSPGYLFYAGPTSTAIQCVCPWAKTVVLLRHPVDRVYYQWVYAQRHFGLRLSLEDWMARELDAMESSGLISLKGGTTLSITREEERQAWKTYQSKRNLAGAIGRSLYVLQLEEWFETLVAVGKDPKQEALIIQSETLEAKPDQEYQRLMSFLGLPATTTPASLGQDSHVEHAEMKKETRQLLQNFFAPYNQRLVSLLTQYGFTTNGDEWQEPLWKS